MKPFSRSLILIAALLMVMTSITLAHQTPRMFSYQGRATDASGNVVVDGNYNFVFSLFESQSSTGVLWSESATLTTKDGIFNHLIGSINPLPNTQFSNKDSLFLQVSFNGQIILPRTPLVSVPYAMRVNSIDGAKGGDVWGSVRILDSNYSVTPCAYMEPDGSNDGAGFLSVRRAGNNSGFIVDGSYLSQGDPKLSLLGTDRSVNIDLNQSSNSSVVLPNSSISSAEMENEPGVGNYINQSGYTLSSGITRAGYRTMVAPTDGWVFVIASAMVRVSHINGSNDIIYFGVSDNPDSLLDKIQQRLDVGSTLTSNTYCYPLTVQGLFPIESGSHTFYFLCEKSSGICYVTNISLTEIFIPTAYTTIVSPSGPSPTTDNPEGEKTAALEAYKALVDKELAEMKAQLEALKQETKNANKKDAEQK